LQLCGIDPPPAVREALMKEAAEREKVSQKQATESERKKKKQSQVARSAANEKKKAFMKTKRETTAMATKALGMRPIQKRREMKTSRLITQATMFQKVGN